MMKWGLIPHWAKDDKLQFSTFNARAEEFTTKPAFRDAWKRGQRCLVVTNGFYEWEKLDVKGKLKQPYAIAMADDAQMVMPVCGRNGNHREAAKRFATLRPLSVGILANSATGTTADDFL
jgi:putative SOS response-associated peptidase YedK